MESIINKRKILQRYALVDTVMDTNLIMHIIQVIMKLNYAHYISYYA
jgi:hypothetical protein